VTGAVVLGAEVLGSGVPVVMEALRVGAAAELVPAVATTTSPVLRRVVSMLATSSSSVRLRCDLDVDEVLQPYRHPRQRPTPRGPQGTDLGSRSWTATTTPWVQNPYCTAPASTRACWTSLGRSALPNPAEVDRGEPGDVPQRLEQPRVGARVDHHGPPGQRPPSQHPRGMPTVGAAGPDVLPRGEHRDREPGEPGQHGLVHHGSPVAPVHLVADGGLRSLGGLRPDPHPASTSRTEPRAPSTVSGHATLAPTAACRWACGSRRLSRWAP
jgi:hypothetical protein